MLNSALPTGNVIINLILYFMSQFMFKQDLAMAYFPDRSKESAGKLLAREIHTNEPLMVPRRAIALTFKLAHLL